MSTDDIYQADTPMFTVRLSRTASGAPTWTVGGSLPLAASEAQMTEFVAKVRTLEALVADAPRAARPERGPGLAAQLRQSILAQELQAGAQKNDGWMTTTELVNGGHRSQVQSDLQALVKAGAVEYQRGKGGLYPSKYRLVKRAPAAAVTQKGKVKA